jgi:CheY-like chemotaxis protein/anti-sigma regulatory factor (Ser/Thr protein kinase)
MPVYLEDFSLKELSKEVLAMMECLAGAKQLKLQWDMAQDIRIRSDKTKVKQILINLMTNGIKFTSTGGVFIEAKRASKASQIHISVRDTGIGIKAENLQHLFKEFKQLDSSTTREYGGTGLGLVISKRFAELLGGTINVESSAGTGTVFTVILPLEKHDAGELTTTSFNTPATDKNNNTLLVIDDDPEILNLLRDSLHGTGYGFAGALTGEEGVAMARKIKPFAITLDIMMPHRDGWSVLQLLKNDPELQSIPVIMVSILDNKSLGFALGVTDYIIKPVKRLELLAKLKAIDGTRPSLKPAPKESRSVLVVDDEVAIVDFLRETLRAEGYAVETAINGKHALSRLTNGKPPDILFLDLMMPEVTGFDVIEAIDKDPALKDVLVIVLTAKHLTPQETDYLQKHVEIIIQKGSKSLPEILTVLKNRLKSVENVS